MVKPPFRPVRCSSIPLTTWCLRAVLQEASCSLVRGHRLQTARHKQMGFHNVKGVLITGGAGAEGGVGEAAVKAKDEGKGIIVEVAHRQG